MSHAQNKIFHWQPDASLQAITARAKLYTNIRDFFAKRKVLEVETPLLAPHTVSDVHIASISVPLKHTNWFLQTSPEYAMKRLLAKNQIAIYQICKAFRCEEIGDKHNIEFTLLEWYRPGFTNQQLIAEIDELLRLVLNSKPAKISNYQEVFLKYCGIDPFNDSLKQLQKYIQQEINVHTCPEDLDTCLNLIFSHHIEPHLGLEQPEFINYFPASQAALAKLCEHDSRIAQRFELFINGIEIANGFQELTDAHEQRQRFIDDNQKRQQLNLPIIELDEYLLAALTHGLPETAGVALGLDRLLMCILNSDSLAEVLCFQ